jgi:hypothetical protein
MRLDMSGGIPSKIVAMVSIGPEARELVQNLSIGPHNQGPIVAAPPSFLMPISHLIRRWGDLNGRQRAWLAFFAAALPLLRLSLRTRGYSDTREWVERWTASGGQRQPSRADVQGANDLARLAQIAGRRGVVAASCLPQALAVYGALRRRGLAPELRIGVRKQDGRFEAHAWVELAGIALSQPNLDHTPLALPQTQPRPHGRSV